MMKQQKKTLRELIKTRKALYSNQELIELSENSLKQLVLLSFWEQAQVVLLYYSLSDEVYTHDLVEHLSTTKQVILPVVKGDELELRRYTGNQDLKRGSYGILEPCGELFEAYDQLDLVVVPGVAFDKYGNRLGRGKGYYDKLLPKIKATKVGLCFDFQYLDQEAIPTESTDIPMDFVVMGR